MHHHRTLQRRVMIIVGSLALLAILVATPLIVNNDLRYDLALQTNLVPGKDAEVIADSADGALLIVIPLNNGDASDTNPWLYRAQFIAWPNEQGNELENLETGERVLVPLKTIDFTSANGDGTLMLMRGEHTDSGDMAAFTIEPESMAVDQLDSADAVPDVPGEWETPTWEKTYGFCHRPSPNKRLVGCFLRADAASYLAGDWQLSVQYWGEYEEIEAIYRGRGFVPWMGFVHNDTVIYLQNEISIVRVEVPEGVLESAPAGELYANPMATPAGTPLATPHS